MIIIRYSAYNRKYIVIDCAFMRTQAMHYYQRFVFS